jgi:3',5'-cyclic AMP phosphodiesterase CpdA
MRLLAVSALALSIATVSVRAQEVKLPNRPDSLHFAVIGDSGTGDDHQLRVAEQLVRARAIFPYHFVIMLGDNLYGGQRPKDFQKKFEGPYKALLDAGVKFYASLGNHDDPNERMYKSFNMNGERYYSFKPEKASVRFFALDSNYMDRRQLDWLEKQLATSGSDWKIAFFHHPLYSSGGTHGSDASLRDQLEPLFEKYGIDVVFAGHEHFYERIRPQNNIYYFTSGGAAKLRRGDIAARSPLTAKGFDQGNSFMLIEIVGDDLYFNTISHTGKLVDSGVIHNPNKPQPVATTGTDGNGRTR